MQPPVRELLAGQSPNTPHCIHSLLLGILKIGYNSHPRHMVRLHWQRVEMMEATVVRLEGLGVQVEERGAMVAVVAVVAVMEKAD